MLTDLEEIKNRLDVVDIIQGYLKLEKAGGNWKACCPFHNEKTPSFMVSPDKQIWHCFGCGEGGDIFGFVMKIEGVEFKDALRVLAGRAGIELKYSKENREIKSKKDGLYEINEWAAKFFETQLWDGTPVSKKILEYLTKRGLKKETIKNFRLGYAPKEWRILQSFLNGKGYKDSDIEEAGLIIASSPKADASHRYGTDKFQVPSSRFYDRFRGRIMFPIIDIQGRVVGFTGRVFEPNFTEEELKNQGKYVNSPETAVYVKGDILYGLDKAKVSLRKNDLCVLVEGNMDLIMSHQAGVDNVIAVSGTALTERQVKMIKRYTENVVMAFDKDEAGNIATKRSIDLAMQNGLNVKIINIAGNTSAKDPADILKEGGGDSIWKEMIKNARGVMDFYFNDAFSRFSPDSVESKREITKILLPVIRKINNKVEQHYWLHILADRLNTKEEFLIDALNSIKIKKFRKYDGSGGNRFSGTPASRFSENGGEMKFDHIGENFLGLLIKHCVNESAPSDLPDELYFTDDRIGKLYKNFISAVKSGGVLKEFYDRLSAEENEYVKKMVFVAEKEWEEDASSIKSDIDFLAREIKIRKIKNDLADLARDIKMAEREKDAEIMEILKEEFKKKAELLNSLNSNNKFQN